MKWRLSYHLWVFLLIGLLISGCSKKEEPTRVVDSPLPTPEAMASVSSPLPAPALGLPNWDAEPAAGKSILRGQIEFRESTTVLGELYLVKAVPTSDPNIDLLELDEERSPRAVIDRSTGKFIFVDVEPGKYSLLAWEPMSSVPLNDPSTDETLFFELVADQVLDIGTLPFP
jgi:hypothetical protein